MKAEQLTGPEAFHAEGPVWAESWGGLRWVDMLAGDVLSLAPLAVTRGAPAWAWLIPGPGPTRRFDRVSGVPPARARLAS